MRRISVPFVPCLEQRREVPGLLERSLAEWFGGRAQLCHRAELPELMDPERLAHDGPGLPPGPGPVAAEDSHWSGALPTPLSQQAFGRLSFPAAPSQSNSLLQLFREEMLHD